MIGSKLACYGADMRNGKKHSKRETSSANALRACDVRINCARCAYHQTHMRKKSKEHATTSVKVKTVKAEKIVSHQWKHAKELGLDKALGHGGIYNLRSKDVSANIVSAKSVTGGKRQVALFSGARGLCFIDARFSGKLACFATGSIDTSKIKSVLHFGTLESAIAYIRKNGKRNEGQTKHGEKFSFVLSNGQHYSVATDGKRLIRLEESACSGNAKNYCYALGK